MGNNTKKKTNQKKGKEKKRDRVFSGKLKKKKKQKWWKKNVSVKLVSDLSFLEGIKEFPVCHSVLLDAYWVTLLGLNRLMLNVDSKSKTKPQYRF